MKTDTKSGELAVEYCCWELATVRFRGAGGAGSGSVQRSPSISQISPSLGLYLA